MSIATWNANILSIIMSLWFLVFPVWLIEISLVLDTSIWSICVSSRTNYLSSWVSSFDHFIFVNSSRVPSFSFVIHFLFLGTESFEPIGLLRFKCVLDSLAMTFFNCPLGTSICVRVFTVGMCDFVTFFIFVKTLGNWFASSYKWIILWTSSSHYLVWG